MPLPKRGSYEELIAHANANSCFVDDPTAAPSKPRRPKSKLHKLMARIHKLPLHQQQLLRDVLSGARRVVQVRGEALTVRKEHPGYVVIGLDANAVERTLNCDGSACSCPDNRFRQRVCKHMEAVCVFRAS